VNEFIAWCQKAVTTLITLPAEVQLLYLFSVVCFILLLSNLFASRTCRVFVAAPKTDAYATKELISAVTNDLYNQQDQANRHASVAQEHMEEVVAKLLIAQSELADKLLEANRQMQSTHVRVVELILEDNFPGEEIDED
jgi:hypothetical protein